MMKPVYLIVVLFFLVACSKEERYGPWGLHNGQEVEVLVSHQLASLNDELILLSDNRPGKISLYRFNDRQAGYSYRVRAKMVVPETPPQDGLSYYLEFMEVLSRKKYEGAEAFQVPLIESYVPGGAQITLQKENGRYQLLSGYLFLTYEDQQVAEQLEQISLYQKQSSQTQKTAESGRLKWRAITATVTHDLKNFGNAYLVSSIRFQEW